MNNSQFLLNLYIRKNIGKKNNLMLRNDFKIPSIVYSKKESIPVFFDKKNLVQLSKIMLDGIKLIKCEIEKKELFVIIKSFQMHPFKKEILHFDFQKVREGESIILDVNLKFIGEKSCPGIKQGGFLIKHATSVQIKSEIENIPNYINIDISNLNINESIFLSDLNLEKITFPILNKKKSSNLLIASVVGSRIDLTKETQNK